MEGNHENQALWERFYVYSNTLNESLRQQTPPPFESDIGYKYIYHPFEYAGEIYRNFLKKYLNGPKKILFVGMNPSRFGSLQTGIPFGDIPTVRDRMKLQGAIRNAPNLHPNITIKGLQSPEEIEESSQRFWNLIKAIFNCEEDFLDRFFENCFVHNFCPLVFIDNNGYNVSFADVTERVPDMEKACLDILQQQLELLQPEIIVPIGWYVYEKLWELDYCKQGKCVLERIRHPIPHCFVQENDWIDESRKKLLKNRTFSYIVRN
ncbi:single-strand selective monofunctional uracil DNA glycosylase-like [Musca autumnalis]|uniref:single-strand selective monofunctional uracil DNA glycosylase-like n=1 Tax=Musca autumnalis TaxID=221902 RepID=UPI003CFA37C2